MPLIAFPTDDVLWTATLSATNEDALYPVANVKNNDPADTFRSTTTSTVITITLAGNITALLLFLGNTNYTDGDTGECLRRECRVRVPVTDDGRQGAQWLAGSAGDRE